MKSIFDNDYRQIVSRLRRARLEKGLSQIELSEQLEVSQSYISKIEQGQIRLDIVQLKKLAKALGLKLEDIIR